MDLWICSVFIFDWCAFSIFTVAVVVAFFFCWAPFHAQRLVAFYGNNQLFVYAITTYVSGILYYLSTCCNPILYHLMSHKFREAFKVCQVCSRTQHTFPINYILIHNTQQTHNSNNIILSDGESQMQCILNCMEIIIQSLLACVCISFFAILFLFFFFFSFISLSAFYGNL